MHLADAAGAARFSREAAMSAVLGGAFNRTDIETCASTGAPIAAVQVDQQEEFDETNFNCNDALFRGVRDSSSGASAARTAAPDTAADNAAAGNTAAVNPIRQRSTGEERHADRMHREGHGPLRVHVSERNDGQRELVKRIRLTKPARSRRNDRQLDELSTRW